MTISGEADVVIVGSGPTGSAYARVLVDALPDAKVLMVEAGPVITEPPGWHVSNIVDEAERDRVSILSQGPYREAYAPLSDEERALRLSGGIDHAMLRRPGLFRVGGEPDEEDSFPAAHGSSGVGGMGIHWFGASPRPSMHERVPFIAPEVMDEALSTAERMLRVSNTQFADSPILAPVQKILGEMFDAGRPADRRVQSMPMALVREGDVVTRSGPEVLLGSLVRQPPDTFELRTETVCTRVLMEGGRAVGVELRDLRTGTLSTVRANYVVVAADSLHTPQLLWASGIRPAALGHYLNEHPQVTLLAIFDNLPGRIADAGQADRAGGVLADTTLISRMTAGVSWIPHSGPDFPFHCQVTLIDNVSLPPEELAAANGKPVLSTTFFLTSEISYDNCVTFSDTETDWHGRPKMKLRFRLSDRDRQHIAWADDLLKKMAAALGRPMPGHNPRTPPNGSSLHYQGTVRMGERDDGTSVCDATSRVWGTENLHVAGNGVIPTETAGNPTLTSVALAILGARKIAEDVKAAATRTAA